MIFVSDTEINTFFSTATERTNKRTTAQYAQRRGDTVRDSALHQPASRRRPNLATQSRHFSQTIANHTLDLGSYSKTSCGCYQYQQCSFNAVISAAVSRVQTVSDVRGRMRTYLDDRSDWLAGCTMGGCPSACGEEPQRSNSRSRASSRYF